MVLVSKYESLFNSRPKVGVWLGAELNLSFNLSLEDARELHEQLTELLDALQHEELDAFHVTTDPPKDIEAMELVS